MWIDLRSQWEVEPVFGKSITGAFTTGRVTGTGSISGASVVGSITMSMVIDGSVVTTTIPLLMLMGVGN